MQEPVGPPVTEHPAIHTEAENGEEGAASLDRPRISAGTHLVADHDGAEGQTLRELALEAYGVADKAILAMLKEANPAIEDINLIAVGQRITFPPLPMEGYESDDRVARHVPSSTDSEHPGAPANRDIYDRIDQDILRPLKEEQPGAYRDFWAGLLYCDTGQRSTGPGEAGGQRGCKGKDFALCAGCVGNRKRNSISQRDNRDPAPSGAQSLQRIEYARPVHLCATPQGQRYLPGDSIRAM